MVEFAFALPVFMLLMFGIMDFGRAIYAYSFVSYAARDATRYAAVHGGESRTPASAGDIQSLVNNEAQGLNTENLAVATSWSPNNMPGSTVTVQVQYSMPLALPFMAPRTIALTSSSQMVIDQ